MFFNWFFFSFSINHPEFFFSKSNIAKKSFPSLVCLLYLLFFLLLVIFWMNLVEESWHPDDVNPQTQTERWHLCVLLCVYENVCERGKKCVCVCMREREKERDIVSSCVCVYLYMRGPRESACECVWVRVSACECVWVRVSACECVWVRARVSTFVSKQIWSKKSLKESNHCW